MSGSGTDKLIYRYRVQSTDYDADGISVDVGGPPSGFGEQVPTTSPALGSVPVDRNYPGVPDHPGHKVDGTVYVIFGAPAYVIAEGEPPVDVTVLLTGDPGGEAVIPITAMPGGGATAADYTVAPTVLTFAPGERRHTVAVAAVDDREWTAARAPGDTTAAVSVIIGQDTIGDPGRTFSVTLSNPVNAVFSGGAPTIGEQLLVRVQSIVEMAAPAVAAVPDTAGNLIVSWEPPQDASPSGYEVEYRMRGTEVWEASCRPAPKRTSRSCSWSRTRSTRRG